jgi:hypothetical protein
MFTPHGSNGFVVPCAHGPLTGAVHQSGGEMDNVGLPVFRISNLEE